MSWHRSPLSVSVDFARSLWPDRLEAVHDIKPARELSVDDVALPPYAHGNHVRSLDIAPCSILRRVFQVRKAHSQRIAVEVQRAIRRFAVSSRNLEDFLLIGRN